MINLENCNTLSDIAIQEFGKNDYRLREKVKDLLHENGIDWKEWLLKKSEKPIKTCKYCGKQIVGKYANAKIFCNSSCAAKYNNSGRKHSEETKKKISVAIRGKNPNPKSEDREKLKLDNKKCIVCGKELTGTKKKYCSKACKARMYSHTRYHTRYSKKKDVNGSRLKYQYIKKLGGKCSMCGYDKNISALVFHHLRDKKFVIDARAFDRCPQELLEEEISKCELVCSNCHHEIHHPNFNKEFFEDLENNNNDGKCDN